MGRRFDAEKMRGKWLSHPSGLAYREQMPKP